MQLLAAQPSMVVLQPETLCNLDCSYCYLPFRKSRNTMSVEVARAVSDSIRPWTEKRPIGVCWHGGEPLTTGRDHLGRLMQCFSGPNVRHEIQTNATLIDDAWCEFFAEWNVRVGVSIDGTPIDNSNRVDWRYRPAHDRIMRGLRILSAHSGPVSVIAVVSNPSPRRARDLYAFALDAGISRLGVNIEEKEGVNTADNTRRYEHVVAFWHELAIEWRKNPTIEVRELNRTLRYIEEVLNGRPANAAEMPINPLPTVAHDGTVTLISPELAGFGPPSRNFASGNVLHHSLDEIIQRSDSVPWIREFATGVATCRATCPYFTFCGGGHPANRHFEHGRLDTTETNYCRNSKIALMEGVLHVAETDASTCSTTGEASSRRRPEPDQPPGTPTPLLVHQLGQSRQLGQHR